MALTLKDARLRLLKGRGKKVYLPELLEEIGKIRSKEDRIQLLKAYQSIDNGHAMLLRYFIEVAFHPAVKWLIPEGVPKDSEGNLLFEYGPEEYGKARGSLFSMYKRLAYFVNPNKVQNSTKRESMFLDMIGAVHKQEADVLVAAKDKDFSKWRGVNDKLFVEAFPEFFPEGYTPESE